MLSARLKPAGTISSVSRVDRIRPPITTTPIGARHAPSPDRDSAVGAMPATTATVVMTIGRARLRPASIRDRKTVVEGKRVHVRVDLGGLCLLKKQQTRIEYT